MATWSRLKVWIAGDVLTAADLNGEFNNIGLVNSFDWAWSGTQTFNSGTAKFKGAGAGIATLTNANTATNRTLTLPDPGTDSTLMALAGAQTVTGAKTFSGANTLIIPVTAPSSGTGSIAYLNNQVNIYDGTNVRFFVPVDKDSASLFNLDVTLSAGIISITGLGGTALATTNAAWISYPSSTGGQTLSQTVTANQTIASGGLKGRWGTTASVAWGSDMPLFIGVTSSDNTAANIRFFLTRNPVMKTTPASTNNIGIDGTAPSTASQDNIVLFGSAANTGYNSRSCRIIGGVRATCDSSAGGVWTITALDSGDGIGTFYNTARSFTMPAAQHGGGGTAPAATKYILTNGGTAPVFTTNNVLYTIGLDGFLDYSYFFDADGGADGATAVSTLLTMPFSSSFPTNDLVCGSSFLSYGGTSNLHINVYEASNKAIRFVRNTSATATTGSLLSEFIAGARSIQGSVRLPVFS